MEIETRLMSVTREKRSFMEALEKGLSGEPERAVFVGRVSAGSFHLQRIIGYRNSFLPVIRGRIDQGGPGSVVSLRMHLHPGTAVFMTIWLSLTGMGAFASLSGIDSVAAGMFAVGVLMVCGGFYPEAIAATRRIRRELGAV